jgi:hypothetical protein
MFTALIALATTFGAFQDAPAATEPMAAAPAPVAQTSEKVVSYLKDAESQLYDPQAAGLKSLEFDLPVEVPMIGNLGSVHVTWAVGGQVTMDVTKAEGVALPPNIPPEAIDQMAQQSAAEVVNTMLNRPISMLLEGGVATLAGAEDGLVKVDFDAPEAREAGVQQQSYYFDDDSVLRRSLTVAEAPGMMGGTMTVTAKQDFHWKTAGADNSLLVPDTQVIEADLGIMVQKVKIAFSYATIDGVLVTSGIEKVIELPEMMGGTQRQMLTVGNLIVNGKTAVPHAVAPEGAPVGG